MRPQRRKTIPGGKEFWTRTDPRPRMPEELWALVEQDAAYNRELRMNTRASVQCVAQCTGMIQDYTAQTGNNGQQKLWTITTERGNRSFYANTLESPSRGVLATLDYLTGEAPQFKAINTSRPEWQVFQGRWPFFINEYFLSSEYYPQNVITQLISTNGKIPFIVRARTEDGLTFEDKNICAHYAIPTQL